MTCQFGHHYFLAAAHAQILAAVKYRLKLVSGVLKLEFSHYRTVSLESSFISCQLSKILECTKILKAILHSTKRISPGESVFIKISTDLIQMAQSLVAVEEYLHTNSIFG